MKRLLCFLAICCALALPAFAQTASEVDVLLSLHAVTYEEAAWFVLRLAETPGLSGPAQAFAFATERNWLPANVEPGARARLDGVSLLIMQSFDFPGGILYSWMKNPHYAYRELVHKGVIQGRSAPDMNVSGDFLLFMTSNVLSLTENTENNE